MDWRLRALPGGPALPKHPLTTLPAAPVAEPTQSSIARSAPGRCAADLKDPLQRATDLSQPDRVGPGAHGRRLTCPRRAALPDNLPRSFCDTVTDQPMLKVLSPYSLLCRVPDDAESVTHRGTETDERAAGLAAGSVAALWQRITALYATGVQPAMQLCVRHQGHVVINRAIGHARGNAPGQAAPDPVPMRVDTPVNLFSGGKAINAMLVHKLVESGHFSLDDRLASHLPGFERHGKGRITIRQILTHRAGLTRMPSPHAENLDLDVLDDPQALREAVLDMRPARRIGGRPAYHSLTGGFVLAELIRTATGREPRELLQELIKAPLEASWLDFGVAPAQLSQVALNAQTGMLPAPIAWQLSRVIGADFSAAIEMSNDPRFLTAVVPSGNVIATAESSARFYQCLLDGGRFQGRRVFAPETVARALAPDRRHGSIDRTIGIPIRYSPGFMLGHAGIGLYGINRHRTFGHLGLSSTLTWARPDTGSVVCLVTTGKPVLGPHIPEMLALFRGLNAFCENRIAR